MSNGNIYTNEQLTWLLDAYTKMPRKPMAYEFNKLFGTAISANALASVCKRRGVITGRSGQFTKGQKAWNEGVKNSTGFSRTRFKPGDINANHRPVGSIRVDKDDVIVIKVKEPKTWMSLHSVRWEEYNGRKVPCGHVVMFADGNRRNFEPENLVLVSRGELAILNKQGLQKQHPEIKSALIAVVKLECKTKQIESYR